ncbi:hypothetical protein SNE40_002975 [Patella caerulea]|uniref:Uncharacterized protein n=1 Tax=Patella caerulea TaxID=87958 RepID=A0AAN8Q0D8_PATCE
MLTSVLERVGLQLPSLETMQQQEASPPVAPAPVTPHPSTETPGIWRKWVDEGRVTFDTVFDGQSVDTLLAKFEASQSKLYDQLSLKCDALFALQHEPTESLYVMLTSVLECVGLQLPSLETMQQQEASPLVAPAPVTPHPSTETPENVNNKLSQ